MAHEDTYPRFIRASELARWAYCQRAWWLEHVRGYTPLNREALARGRAFHDVLGRKRYRFTLYRRWAWRVLLMAFALALIVLGIVLLRIG